jgi:hypothetical protein
MEFYATSNGNMEDEADVPREQVQEQQTEDSLNLKAGGMS